MTEVVENKTSNRSKLRDVWDQFKSHKGALLGGFIFFSIVIIVMIGPFFWPFEANGIDIRSRNQGPSLLHPFGTDQLGRDTLARMMAGGRTSIAVGLAAMALSLFFQEDPHTMHSQYLTVGRQELPFLPLGKIGILVGVRVL